MDTTWDVLKTKVKLQRLKEDEKTFRIDLDDSQTLQCHNQSGKVEEMSEDPGMHPVAVKFSLTTRRPEIQRKLSDEYYSRANEQRDSIDAQAGVANNVLEAVSDPIETST